MPNTSSPISGTVPGATVEACRRIEDSLLLYHAWHVPFGGVELRMLFAAVVNCQSDRCPISPHVGRCATTISVEPLMTVSTFSTGNSEIVARACAILAAIRCRMDVSSAFRPSAVDGEGEEPE